VKTIDDLIAYIEHRFPAVVGLPASRCQTGDQYVVLGAEAPGQNIEGYEPGVIREGFARDLAFDEETAVMQALIAFDNYAAGKRGTVYWRHPHKAELGVSTEELVSLETLETRPRERSLYSVWLRLVISDKPVLYETIEQLPDAA
jgi:hypothetical protein